MPRLPEATGGIRDLGTLNGRVLIFGGAYSNRHATAAMLGEAVRLGIPPQNVICTGDVVAYCADPQACVDALRGAGIRVVMGNCEESLGADAGDCGCGFEEGSICDNLSAQWYAYARDRVSRDARLWMAALPRWLRFRLGGRTLTAVHATPSETNRFVFPSTAAREKRAELDLAGTDGVICGHSGLPFSEIVDGRLWHNAGVIGVPANDGTPRTWYSLLEAEAGGIRISHRPLYYDHAGAARRMREEGLAEEYANALTDGLWDNCEILPPAETAQRGRPLEPWTLTWANGSGKETDHRKAAAIPA